MRAGRISWGFVGTFLFSIACKGPKPAVSRTTDAGSPVEGNTATNATSTDVGTAPSGGTSLDAGSSAQGTGSALPAVLHGSCPPRKLPKDPGPTKATKEPLMPFDSVAKVMDECVKHVDCRAQKYGRCVPQKGETNNVRGRTIHVPAHNACVYDECMTDDECRANGTNEPRAELVCTCRADEHNTCTFANCRKDSDCPSPFPCGPMNYCYSAKDGCRTKRDCKGSEECSYDWGEKRYSCRVPQAPLPG